MQKIKNIIRSIWNEFIYGGHLLSLSAVSVVFTPAILLKVEITIDFLIIIYSSTYAAYLYNRYKELKEDCLTNPERTRHLKKQIKKIPLIIFCFTTIFIVTLLCFSNFTALIFGLIIFVIGISYSLFFKKITQKIIGFKSFYIAFSWSLLVIFLFVYYSFSFTSLSVFFVIIFIFIKCFADTSFYDIKDIESDKKENLLTLAIILGKKRLIKLLNLMSILALIPIIFGVHLRVLPIFSLMLCFSIPITFYLLRKIERSKNNVAYLSEVSIGIEKISWSFLILLGNFLL